MYRIPQSLTLHSRSCETRDGALCQVVRWTFLAAMLLSMTGCIDQWQEETKSIGNQIREQRRSTEAARQRGETGRPNNKVDRFTVVMVGWSRFELEDAIGKPTRVVAGGSSKYPNAKRYIYEGTDGSTLGVLFDNVVLDVDYPIGHGVTSYTPKKDGEDDRVTAAPVEATPAISDPEVALPGLYAVKIAGQWKDVGGKATDYEFGGDHPVLAAQFQGSRWNISVPGATWFGTTDQLSDMELVIDAGSLPSELQRMKASGVSATLRLVVSVARGDFALRVDGLTEYSMPTKATNGTVKIDRRTWANAPRGSSLWDILGYAQDGSIHVPAEAQLKLLNVNDGGALIGYEIPALPERAGVSQINVELTEAKATESSPRPQKELLSFVQETVATKMPAAVAQLVPSTTGTDTGASRVDVMLSNTTARLTEAGWQVVGWANLADRKYHYECDVRVEDGEFQWTNLTVAPPSPKPRIRSTWPMEARQLAIRAVAQQLAMPAEADVRWSGTLAVNASDGRKVLGDAEYDGETHSWSCTIDGDTNDQLRATRVDIDGEQTWLTGVLSIDSQVRPRISRSSFHTWKTITLEEIQRVSAEATEVQLDALRRVDQKYLRQGHYHLFEIPNRGEMKVTWTGSGLRHSEVQLGVWNGEKFEYQGITGGDKDYQLTRMIARPANEPLVYFVVAGVSGEVHLRSDAVSIEYFSDSSTLAEAGAADLFRSWTAKSGQQIKAKYVAFVRGKVKLELENGKSTYVDVTALSDADQRFVELRTGRGSASQDNAEQSADATSPDAEAGEEDEGFRVWTATNGKTVTAKLLNVIGAKVKLEPQEGKAFYTDLKLLSEEDQKYVEEQNSRKRR